MKAQKIAAWGIIIALTIVLLIEARNLLRPLVIAVVLTYLIGTLSNFFRKLRIGKFSVPHWLAVTAAFVVLVGFLALTVEIMIGTVNRMALSAPEYQLKLETMGDNLLEQLRLDYVPRTGAMLEDIDVRPVLANLGANLSNFAGKFILIIVYVVFLLLEQELFRRKFRLFFNNDTDYRHAESTIRRISESVRTYLSVKAFVSLLTAVLCYTALSIIGLRHAPFWAFLIFLLNFIPNIGSWVSTALPAVFAMIQFDDWSSVFITLITIAIIQLGIGNYVDPRLMGRTLNISPLVILFSLVLWGAIWGVLGMVLSVPITVAMLIIFSQFQTTRKVAMLLSRTGKIAEVEFSKQHAEIGKEEEVGSP